MKNNTLRLKRHETFSIREGWLEKVINIFSEDKNCFSKDRGQQCLGIGTNMVKSLRYWSEACHLIKFDQFRGNEFTEFGQFLYKNDRYLSNMTSWWLIHMYLVTDFNNSPVFNVFFNMNTSKFEKEQLFNQIMMFFDDKYEVGAESSLEADINVLIKSYYSDDYSNPENNMNCPLSKLGLLSAIDRRTYCKNQPKFSSLDYRVVFFAMQESWKDNNKNKTINSFNLEDMYDWDNNPVKIFNLTKSSMYMYLDEMKKNGLIKLIKTAGLNTITIEKIYSLEELFN